MTHKEKDCVERPRSSKKAAWKTGVDIAPNEVILRFEDHGKINYSMKRDQWQGYDADEYRETVVERFNRVEADRVKIKEQQRAQRMEEKLRRKEQAAADGVALVEETLSDGSSDYGSEDEDGEKVEFVQRDEAARDFQGRLGGQGGVGGAPMKVTVRNLRIREDTPKYLHNLALDSAFYDPKARSMRSNPFPDQNPEDVTFAGDNFVRQTGDALELARTQVLCWDMQARGESIDMISNPSQTELMKKQFTEKKGQLEETKRKALLEKYGGAQHMQADPQLRLGQTEAYVEYSRDGRVIKGAGKTSTRSKYEEDVLVNNHTSVWGSYYCKPRDAWGFACCHSLVRNSYCVGENKREFNDNANKQALDAHQERRMLDSRPASDRSAAPIVKRSDVYGESSGAVLDEAKVKDAMRKEEEFMVC